MSTARRKVLIDRFDQASPRWLSLDVFDTLLARPFERPTNVFYEVHRHLVESSGVALSIPANKFAELRVKAEEAARLGHPSREVCIEEVCKELSQALGGRPDAVTLVSAELATERAHIQIDRDVAALIQHSASKGVPYFVVSDMYLRSEHILELLREAIARSGLDVPLPAHVFVSGERRTNKGGSMFDLVLQTLDCQPRDVFHVGDHPLSDVESPKRRGIPAFHYFRETPYVDRVLALEARWLEASNAPEMHYDLGLRTLRTKALASTQETPDDRLSHFQYGAFILGPVLTLFAEWVVADCVKQKQPSVHCLMREGHLLAPLVERAARAAGVDLEVHKLWASRYAFRGASFRDGSDPELRGYFIKRHAVPLHVVARDLGVDESLLRRKSGIEHWAGLAPNDVDRVIDAIVSDRALRVQLLASSAAKRKRLFAYFESEGVFENDRLALVDLGWGGTLQKTLAQVFAGQAKPRHVRGLYLATHEKLLELPLDTCSADSFLFHLGAPHLTCGPLRRTPEILEHACMPELGSFRGIDALGNVDNFPQAISQTQLDQIAELQRGVLHFADLWLPGAHERRRRISHADWQALLERLRAILARSLHNPLESEVPLFASWEHDPNDGATANEPLLGSAELRRRARFMSYYEIMNLSWIDCFWPQGLAVEAGKTEDDWSKVWRGALRYPVVRTGGELYARSAAAVTRMLGWK